MRLLPKRPDASGSAEPEVTATSAVGPAAAGGTKGRPTPKRRDAAPVRGPVTAPKTRKEALQRQRQQAKTTRSARSKPAANMTVQERRALLRSGDPSVLPRRDQGPTRKLARDYVDSHRMISNYLLLLFPIMVASYVVPFAQFVVLAGMIVLIGETYVVGRRIRRLAVQRNGRADGGPMTIGFYAVSRAYLPRRWRLPGPQVERGDPI